MKRNLEGAIVGVLDSVEKRNVPCAWNLCSGKEIEFVGELEVKDFTEGAPLKLQEEGRDKEKKLRMFFWDNRKNKVMNQEGAVVWVRAGNGFYEVGFGVTNG
jgi:hypothetical protein